MNIKRWSSIINILCDNLSIWCFPTRYLVLLQVMYAFIYFVSSIFVQINKKKYDFSTSGTKTVINNEECWNTGINLYQPKDIIFSYAFGVISTYKIMKAPNWKHWIRKEVWRNTYELEFNKNFIKSPKKLRRQTTQSFPQHILTSDRPINTTLLIWVLGLFIK